MDPAILGAERAESSLPRDQMDRIEINEAFASVLFDVPPSDHGIEGVIPLPPPEWDPSSDILTDADWADQNRKINNLLMRGILPP